MDTKVDKQIKNYLRKISYDRIKASTNNTIHYKVRLCENDIDIRFSDHFSNNSRNSRIDIIKIQDSIYTIRVENMFHVTLNAVDTLPYIKAFVLLYSEINGICDKLIEAQNTINKLHKNTVLSELKEQKEKNQKLININIELTDKCIKLTSENSGLKLKLEKVKQCKNNLVNILK